MAMQILDEPTTRESQDWFIDNILPKGRLVLLAGESGIGKSSLTAYLASIMPEKYNVMFWLLEDDVQTYINKIGRHDNIKYCDFKDSKGLPYIPKPSEIEEAIMKYDISLLVIDPIAFMATGDINDNQKVRALLMPLQEVAKNTCSTILGVHHFSKGKGRVKDRATGAHAWVATPRHVLSFVKDTDDSLYLEVTKSNIAKTGTSWLANSEVDKYTMKITSLEKAEEGAAQRAINNTYDDDLPKKEAPVIRNLKEEFALGSKFSLEDVDRLGNRKSFYNWIEKNQDRYQTNRVGKKAYYWFI